MFGYTFCSMFRNSEITEEVKKQIDMKKQEFKEEMEREAIHSKAQIIDFVTRMPRR